MENPFELILQRLNTIEALINNLSKPQSEGREIIQVLNFDQASKYLSLSKSTLYKMTSERNIPHFKRGKRVFFKRSELENWLTEVRVRTRDEIEKEAATYISRKKMFK